MRLRPIALVIIAATLWGGTPALGAAAREVADEDVDFVIDQIKRFLYDRQGKDGHWTARGSDGPHGGTTALAIFALLEAGENPQDPRIKTGLDALVATNPKGAKELYFRTIRAMALSEAIAAWKDSPYLAALEDDLRWLTTGAAAAQGAWGYAGPERTGDNSCSQFALLALWEAERAGIKIPPALISIVESTWLRRQQKDGGWAYAAIPGVQSASTVSMTAAGLASLYICQDVLTTTCGPYRHQRQAEAAWEFLANNLSENYIANDYLAFCVQRVGMASGSKFIGKMDWYAAGAGLIARPDPRGRSFGGKWGGIVRASFELIFLARGRFPITFNKLQHGQGSTWNFHSRDLSHFAEYMRRTFERRMRWQNVQISDNVQMLLDAPILLVTGAEPLDFTEEQWDKMREYTLRGGTLLLMPIHASKPFAESARAGLENLYAALREQAGGYYALEDLTSDHPIYVAHQKVANGATIAPLSGVSDGSRLLAVICHRDLGHSWQKGITATQSIEHMLGANFFLYATGANQLSTRLRPVFVTREGPEKIKHVAKVAWLRHGGNWCTQPYALEYLSQKLVAENRVSIELTSGVEAQADKLKGNHLLWITGTSRFSLDEGGLEALREYIRDGGTVFVNAVGGSREFDESARAMLDELLPAGQATMGYVGEESPLMTGVIKDATVDFRGPPVGAAVRTVALRKVARTGPPLTLYMEAQTGRIVAVYARYGIHDTLDGHTSHEALSFMPSSARDIAANVVLYSMLAKEKLPDILRPPAAATAPAEQAVPTGEGAPE